jgi:AcrR family transcriptional regulator
MTSAEPTEAQADLPRGQRRNANRVRRSSAIREAAARLITETGGTDFTMQHLAIEAGVSLATAYNVIGTKAAVLYSLLDASLDELAATQSRLSATGDTADIIAMVRHAVDFFAARPDYYRPLMRYLLGVYEPERRPLFMARALNYWRFAVNFPVSGELAQALHLSFAGALDLWVHVEIDSRDFRQLMEQQTRILIAGIRSSTDIPMR